MDWDFQEKNTVRSLICNSRANIQNALLLPSTRCLDVAELIKNQAFSDSSHVTAIERDREAAVDIQNKLREWELPNTVLVSDLIDTEIDSKERFDFVFLDTCGQLSPSMLRWLIEFAQKRLTTADADIHLAFSMYYRTGWDIPENFKTFMASEKLTYTRTKPTFYGPVNLNTQGQQHKIMATMLSFIFGKLEKSYIYKSETTVPMHVFSFKARKELTGITNIIKFLNMYSSERPKILRPAVAASLQRHGIGVPKRGREKKVVTAKDIKSLKVSTRARRDKDLLKLLQQMQTNIGSIVSLLQEDPEEKLKEIVEADMPLKQRVLKLVQSLDKPIHYKEASSMLKLPESKVAASLYSLKGKGLVVDRGRFTVG